MRDAGFIGMRDLGFQRECAIYRGCGIDREARSVLMRDSQGCGIWR